MDVKAMVNNSMNSSSLDGLAQLERQGKSAKDIQKVKKLASDFEAMFVEQMLKGMRTSVQKSGLVDGGNAEEIYTSMLDSEYAKNMANQRTTGLADMVERQLLDSMGVKLGPSDKISAKQGVKAYGQGAFATLQDGQKPVTIESRVSSKIQSAGKK